MKTSRTSLIIFLLLTALLVALVLYFNQPATKYDWKETYLPDSKEPYGTDIIASLLESSRSPGHFTQVNSELSDDFPTTSSANLVLIGQAYLFDSSQLSRLLNFVKAGNTAFLSSHSSQHELISKTVSGHCDERSLLYDYEISIWDSTVTINFSDPALRADSGYTVRYYREGKPWPGYSWSYLPTYQFCPGIANFKALGTIGNQVNFARIDYGAGAIFLHSTPLVFTNFNMLDTANFQYASRIFSYLNDGPIYWDNYHQIGENISRRRNGMAQSERFSETPLQYILSQAPLAWAWYILVALTILYVIFRAKRMQRIIPVLAPNTNTSLEFIQTIGKLYFQKGNPRKVALQKMKYFQHFIRNRYNIPVQDWTEAYIRQVHLKSEVPQSHLEKIGLMTKNIQSSNFVTDNTLAQFHQLLEEFYSRAK